jgi:hypothetical protein
MAWSVLNMAVGAAVTLISLALLFSAPTTRYQTHTFYQSHTVTAVPPPLPLAAAVLTPLPLEAAARGPDLGSASELVERQCVTYRVDCVPGTAPAAGRIVAIVPTPPARQFCKGHGAVEPPSARVKCACPAAPLRSQARPGSTRCDAGSFYLAYQCSSVPLVPAHAMARAPAPAAGGVDVLLIVSECYGHGLFAQVERVLNQLRYAARRGLVPVAYLGEQVFTSADDCLSGANGYWDARALSVAGGRLDSVWDYYFEPLSDYRLGAATLPNGSRVRSVQVASMPLLYRDQLLGGFDGGRLVSAYGRTDVYDGAWWLQRRRTANAYLRRYVRVRPELLARVAAQRALWARGGPMPPLLGVHLRGTDKVVRRKVLPARYFPWVDAYVRAHAGARVFVATDDAAYLRAMVGRYGDTVVYRQAGYTSANVISDARLGAREKGEDALLDALLLSGCDFVLKTTSALSEFALWLNVSLHDRHIDLQFEDSGASQTVPPWASHLDRRSSRIDELERPRGQPGKGP